MPTKSAISFSLLHVPISLHTATTDNDIRFNQLCEKNNSRVRYKKVCSQCNKEVNNADIIKGFEYEKDKYVVVTDDDFETIKTEKDRTMHILHFANLDEINPVYYEKTYHATPEKGGEKAFELLRSAMMELQQIAIAKTVLGSKETLLALVPREDGMLVQILFFDDEVKELPQNYTKPKVVKAELEMAKQLITAMGQSFQPEEHKDEYQERLRELIENKIAGKEIVAPNEETPDNVIDIMDALQASLNQQTKPKKSTSKKTATAKKKEAS